MRSILVIHDAGDRVFVEGRLTKPLPALGFEGWQSSLDLEARRRPAGAGRGDEDQRGDPGGRLAGDLD